MPSKRPVTSWVIPKSIVLQATFYYKKEISYFITLPRKKTDGKRVKGGPLDG